MGFEVGKLFARIQVEGLQTFGRDLQQAGKEFSKLDETGRQASANIGRSLLTVGASIVALAGLAVARFAEFDAAMSESAAVIDGFAQKQNELRKAALDAGAVTIYTAKEAANAQAELGKAGINASDILGGALTGSLALAAAGQLQVADAAEIAATAMTQFKLSGEDVPHIADLLAAGANKAQGGVTDLSYALKQSGLVASQMGLSIEETVGTLSAFASAGLLGSDAGTSFRTMLLNLATPTKQQTELLKKYNIEAYDQQGNFVGITSLAGQLQTRLGGLTQAERDHAMGIIFGSDAIRAANVLYNQGADGIAHWTDEVNDANAATRIAAQLQDNLAGDVEKLGGAIDSALIQTGEGANGVLRDMVQWLTSLVDAYTELDPGIQQFILFTGIAVGVVALLGGAFLVAVPKIVAFREALLTLNQQVPALRKTLGGIGSFLTGPWGIAFAVGVGALIAFGNAQRDAENKAKSYAETLESSTHAVTAATRELAKEALSQSTSEWLTFGFNSGYDSAKKLKIGLEGVTDAAIGNADALTKLKSQTIDVVNDSDALAEAAEKAGISQDEWAMHAQNLWAEVQKQNKALEDGIEVATQKSDADKKGAAAQYESADAYLAANDEASGLLSTLNELLDTLNEANGVNQDAISANIDYRDALADVDEAIANARNGVEGYALTLDLGTEAGRNNMDMLVGLADQAWDAAEAQLKLDGNTINFQKTLEASREELIQRAMDFGYTRDQAVDLANKILAIPSEKEIKLLADTTTASNSIDGFLRKYNGYTLSFGARITLPDGSKINPGMVYADGGYHGSSTVKHFAGGGENRIAQFAAGGDYRVWAEPETGGEWYLPDSPAKRTRSLQIAEKMLAGWGYDMVPRGGSGAGTASAAAAPGASVTVLIGDQPLREVARQEINAHETVVTMEYEGGLTP